MTEAPLSVPERRLAEGRQAERRPAGAVTLYPGGRSRNMREALAGQVWLQRTAGIGSAE